MTKEIWEEVIRDGAYASELDWYAIDNKGNIGMFSAIMNAPIPEIVKKSYDNLDSATVPERDLLSQAILSFGPAIFGSLTGESGAISQLKGGETGRGIYENMRKEDSLNAKSKNEAFAKRYNDLLKLRESGSDRFTKAQQLELDAIKTKFSSVKQILSAKPI